MYIEGKKVFLQPISLEEVIFFYEIATDSEGTPYWYGEYSGEKIPDYGEFTRVWDEFYFTDTDPDMGRWFFIVAEGNDIIGEISYNMVDRQDDSTEVDIIIAYEEMMGSGYGTDALNALALYLNRELGIKKCWMEVPEDSGRVRVFRQFYQERAEVQCNGKDRR